MAVSWLHRLASGTPVAVFGVAGKDARERVEDLALQPAADLTASPRHATVLLVAGPIPEEHLDALARIHDQIPHPRATLWWGPRSGTRDDGVEISAEGDPHDLGVALTKLREELWTGIRDSEPHWLPDEPPHPWKDLGDHGQGGEGMMGGKPYGRPMAMTDEDLRDGLALDRLPFTVGPFFPHFPPGLVLDLALQGDVIQEAHVASAPYPQAGSDDATRRRLRRLHRRLRAAGAEALAERALRLARADSVSGQDVDRFETRLRRTGLGTWVCPTEDSPISVDGLEDALPGMEWGRAVLALAGAEP